ncbi:50S ribosomal protein L14 [Candidatus Dojkabacteria bacterium CG_4_10_14_3_um_filter_Dojkabacteria_WS6_41_9]|uniref:Large ribosomal subunit protein uL14 n=1 Tax=Candidatus Dojkabacteria bacterium CG_4_10_14_0_2_um_filter_Dojkabacteria_WS6_41_15 TaxID=2014249 RepID=A0A2M7W1R7_9BACT|nr:MAG: 50S ribosomal protein L14 [Candidatus Dojkabacteria bacterium CG_4_10_14_3_um_filter_Dojkabacteria_WS6_41_9]PJA13788.1 MAG: 50S ribosomal protein L14 [Candidatus Dojkabacteria bacterium CG_4_10_14_0_2_um_filter_Dojkabacteria_WS6_41_15]
MIKFRTVVNIADNTGATSAMIIGTFGGTKKKIIRLADVVKVTVKSARPTGSVKKSEMHRAVVVRVKKEHRREDGTYIRFDDNAVVILEGITKEPKGTRIFGPVARELKAHGFDKITYLAPETL